MQFTDLNLIEPLLRALTHEGYTQPTPIQQQAIPHVLAGRDILGCAQTGTGKTAAFALPILQRMTERPSRSPRVIRTLVLTPTRELATQIGDSFAAYGKNLPFSHTVIFGGVKQSSQVRAIQQRPDVLVATPGRLLDLLSQRLISLSGVEILVLDEADRMLDMGFIHDVRRIIELVPKARQTLLFSATMPPDILALANKILNSPARVEVTPVASTAEKIEQSVFFVEKTNKRALLAAVLRDDSIRRVLVFTRTKHGANRVVEQLDRSRVVAAAIHGNKSQSAREKALLGFKQGDIRVLVATDIAARGIDVEGITHVINYELPNIPETYVHRIGRTARAGASGVALSFCDREERAFLKDIERLIRMRIPVSELHVEIASAPSAMPENAERSAEAPKPQRRHWHRGGQGPSTRTNRRPEHNAGRSSR